MAGWKSFCSSIKIMGSKVQLNNSNKKYLWILRWNSIKILHCAQFRLRHYHKQYVTKYLSIYTQNLPHFLSYQIQSDSQTDQYLTVQLNAYRAKCYFVTFTMFTVLQQIPFELGSRKESQKNLTNPYLKIQDGCSAHQAIAIYCLIALLSFLCLIKSVIHTVLSNFYLWTCYYSVCMHKTLHNALLSTCIANNG